MPIDFSKNRWDDLLDTYTRWWAGELGRPLLQLSLGGYDPGRPEPELPGYHFTSFYDFSVPPEAIVDRWDWGLSTHRFVGDGFPSVWPNFGAGVMAAFLGARVLNRPDGDTTWFEPVELQEPADIHLAYDAANPWYQRVQSVMRAAAERWEGLVQVGMTDLGGSLDVVSSFLPGERLLVDLYDHPDEIKRINWDVNRLWKQYYRELSDVLRPTNPGYTAWTSILSAEPYYVLQCDFCYMISPDMFDEFVKPELADMCKHLTNPFYHLDGPGQLPHLDSLLQIEELKGVQWIPGAGQPPLEAWTDVFRKIHDAGKLIQIFEGGAGVGLGIIDVVADAIGTAEGIILIGGAHRSRESEVMELVERYGT